MKYLLCAWLCDLGDHTHQVSEKENLSPITGSQFRAKGGRVGMQLRARGLVPLSSWNVTLPCCLDMLYRQVSLGGY